MTTPKVDLEIFDTKRTFEDLGLNDSLVRSVKELGFVHPTIIQSKLIPLALSKIDVLGQSRTGSGKTAAFGLPALHLLEEGDAFGALILVPTRELAIQVAKEIEVLGKFTSLKAVPKNYNPNHKIREAPSDHRWDSWAGDGSAPTRTSSV